MARPRTIRDEDLLAATARVVERDGPIAFTLAAVAREAGVSAPLLLQRFETKRGLLLALSAAGAGQVREAFAAARGAHASPLAALHAALRAVSGPHTPRAIASGLAFLQLDVTDPAFRERAVAWLEELRDGIRPLLEDAVRARELRRVDAAELARAVEVAYHGATISWAVRQHGSLPDALVRDVDAVLEPHRRRVKLPRARRGTR